MAFSDADILQALNSYVVTKNQNKFATLDEYANAVLKEMVRATNKKATDAEKPGVMRRIKVSVQKVTPRLAESTFVNHYDPGAVIRVRQRQAAQAAQADQAHIAAQIEAKIVFLDQQSTSVKLDDGNVSVRLDLAQNKHQDPDTPIGTRKVRSKSRFVPECDGDWHIANTLPHMVAWAKGLEQQDDLEEKHHGQGKPVGKVHYEGFCTFLRDKRIVIFHCYPTKDSPFFGTPG